MPARHGKPVVGNGDVHRLRQLGTTFSRIDAEAHPDAICQAIREGRVQVDATPLSWLAAAGLIAELTADSFARAVLPSRRTAEAFEAGS